MRKYNYSFRNVLSCTYNYTYHLIFTCNYTKHNKLWKQIPLCIFKPEKLLSEIDEKFLLQTINNGQVTILITGSSRCSIIYRWNTRRLISFCFQNSGTRFVGSAGCDLELLSRIDGSPKLSCIIVIDAARIEFSRVRCNYTYIELEFDSCAGRVFAPFALITQIYYLNSAGFRNNDFAIRIKKKRVRVRETGWRKCRIF